MPKKSKVIIPVPKEKRTQPYWAELNKVIDPELNLGIVDLGLIYDVQIKNKDATVYMTLTSPACPVGPTIIREVEDRMRLFRDLKNVYIEVVWDPFWTQERIDPEIRELMFGL
ncbi:MAG: metal-sulfur cluster assembly factor [Patescibacteria group bacterium]